MLKHHTVIVIVILGLMMFGGAAYVGYKVYRHNTKVINAAPANISTDRR